MSQHCIEISTECCIVALMYPISSTSLIQKSIFTLCVMVCSRGMLLELDSAFRGCISLLVNIKPLKWYVRILLYHSVLSGLFHLEVFQIHCVLFQTWGFFFQLNKGFQVFCDISTVILLLSLALSVIFYFEEVCDSFFINFWHYTWC